MEVAYKSFKPFIVALLLLSVLLFIKEVKIQKLRGISQICLLVSYCLVAKAYTQVKCLSQFPKKPETYKGEKIQDL
jgi:hypothetical protein